MADDGGKKRSHYVLQLTEDQMSRLFRWCDERCWSFYSVPYARFAFRGDQVGVVGYESGKVVVQGKKTESFVTDILEGEITRMPQLGYEEILHPDWFEPHAGMDESGKGDFFGPLVASCVIADGEHVRHWLKNNLKESKKTSGDAHILRLDKMIRETRGVVVHTAYATVKKYNELYEKFGNLNELLAWMHAVAIDGALRQRRVPWGLLDQFSKRPIVNKYLKTKDFVLRQRTRAEDDPVVAAASVVARAVYIREMRTLGGRCGIPLAKGVNATVHDQGRQLLQTIGLDRLGEFAKMHFRTAHNIQNQSAD
jgi:ribonuclease HIII